MEIGENCLSGYLSGFCFPSLKRTCSHTHFLFLWLNSMCEPFSRELPGFPTCSCKVVKLLPFIWIKKIWVRPFGLFFTLVWIHYIYWLFTVLLLLKSLQKHSNYALMLTFLFYMRSAGSLHLNTHLFTSALKQILYYMQEVRILSSSRHKCNFNKISITEVLPFWFMDFNMLPLYICTGLLALSLWKIKGARVLSNWTYLATERT